MTPSHPLAPERVIDNLNELRQLTGDANGAQRPAWTDAWLRARAWLKEKLADLPLDVETDLAGNTWYTLRGATPQTIILGSHLDSVPNGGWLDGCLGVLAGAEVLRHIASAGQPPITVRLVDWADEEGRFGHSLLGSSSVTGFLDAHHAQTLRDKDGIALPDALKNCGVDVARMGEAQAQLTHAKAYLELHIEQGPVLEAMGLPLAVVQGTCGVERNLIRFTGQAAHAGSTPMHMRRDALAAAAKFELEIREIAKRRNGVCTIGSVKTEPGIMTAVVGQCDCSLDQRHLDPRELAAMLNEAQAASERFAREENVSVSWTQVYRLPPSPFNPALIEMGEAAVREASGASHAMPSGPLHDASAVARAGIPTVMLFVQSLRGLSHTKEEDTREEHVRQAVCALDGLAARAMDWVRM